MQTPNPTAARAGSEMEQALTKVLNEKSALRAENAALRAALESIIDSAHENASELSGRHMRELGVTTIKNRAIADGYIADLKAIQAARAALAKEVQS